jgi:hypothetical protein
MFIKKTISTTFVCFLTIMMISGCNGGGGDSGTPNGSEGNTKINASNAKPIAAAAFASVESVKSLSVSSGVVSGRSDGASSSAFNYADFIASQVAAVQEQNLLMGRGTSDVETAVISKTLDCQLNIKGDIANPPWLSVGDKLTFTFDSCNYNSEVVVSGGLGITVTQISDNFSVAPPFDLAVDVVLSDFKVTTNGSSYISNGDLSLLVAKDPTGNMTVQLNGASLAISLDSASVNNSLALTDFAIDLKNNVGGDYSLSQQGTLKLIIPFITVGTSFTTNTPFTGNRNTGTGYPTAGELHLTGGGGSQAWVIAQPDGVNIQIDVDLNGDGNADETLMTTWTELDELF